MGHPGGLYQNLSSPATDKTLSYTTNVFHFCNNKHEKKLGTKLFSYFFFFFKFINGTFHKVLLRSAQKTKPVSLLAAVTLCSYPLSHTHTHTTEVDKFPDLPQKTSDHHRKISLH
jgi:hypothetical protein